MLASSFLSEFYSLEKSLFELSELESLFLSDLFLELSDDPDEELDPEFEEPSDEELDPEFEELLDEPPKEELDP